MSESEVWQAIERLEQRLGAFISGVEIPRPASAFAVRYTTNIAQTINSGVSTIVDYATAAYDIGGRVTTGASWGYICASAGIYSVKASVLFASSTQWALGEAGSLNIFKNGVNVSSLDRFDAMNSSATAQFMRLRGADDIMLAVGDRIDIRVAQTSGASLVLHTDPNFNYVAIHKIP